jgi:hypothetical protein
VGKSLRDHLDRGEVVPAQDRPPDVTMVNAVTINEITMESNEMEWTSYDVMSKKDLEAEVRTMYKWKDKKIRSANTPLSNGVNLSGNVMRDTTGNEGLGREMPSGGKKVPQGSRLTPERLAKMKIGTRFLSREEKQIFIDILFEYEGAIAFDDSEMGLLNPRIELPIKMHTVPHQPWQQLNLRLPRAMQEEATRQVKEKIDLGILEFSQSPYRSRYFLVAKKEPGSWRFINDVQSLNKVTIREAGMPPAVDEFSEDFAGYPITSAIDYYSGYSQLSLDAASRDYTAFLTDIGLVRNTRLPQGWTNSVSTFQRIICKVH